MFRQIARLSYRLNLANVRPLTLGTNIRALRCLSSAGFANNPKTIETGQKMKNFSHSIASSQGKDEEEEKEENEYVEGKYELSEKSSSNSKLDFNDPLNQLERKIENFEQTCNRYERVSGESFAIIFNEFTKIFDYLNSPIDPSVKEKLSSFASTLILCCGSLMDDTPAKAREMLAANLWQFIKEKKLRADISHYNKLIIILNDNGTTYDPQKILEEMASVNITPDLKTYEHLVHQYCLQGNFDGATGIIAKMKDSGMLLRERVFASLILLYSQLENSPTVDEMFDLMKANGVVPSNRAYTAAIISQIKSLKRSPDDEVGLKKLIESANKKGIFFSIEDVIKLINNLYEHRENATVAQFYNQICHTFSGPGFMNSRIRTIMNLFALGDYKKAAEVYWSIKPSDTRLKGSRIGFYYIRMLAFYKHTPHEHCMNECAKMMERNYNSEALLFLQYNAAKYGNLSLLRSILERLAKREIVPVHYYWPLIAQASGEEELVDILQNYLNPTMEMDDLEETFKKWVWPHFQDNPARLFELNKELGYSKKLLVKTFVEHAKYTRQAQEAVKFLEEAPRELLNSYRNESKIES